MLFRVGHGDDVFFHERQVRQRDPSVVSHHDIPSRVSIACYFAICSTAKLSVSNKRGAKMPYPSPANGYAGSNRKDATLTMNLNDSFKIHSKGLTWH